MAKICIIPHFKAKGDYFLKTGNIFSHSNGIITSSEANNFLENFRNI